MKVLLSAYACEPGKGSEPGVGWNWALEIARLGHEVWVLTRTNNRAAIEAGLAQSPPAGTLHFLYYDLPTWARWWKKGNRGVRLYYLLWQWGAYRRARKAHANHRFERVHHVTFVSARQPSFMGNLGVPFTFGPVAGGERAPWALRAGFGWRGRILDTMRDLANMVVKFDPFMRRTFRQAERIYVTSDQTLSLLPSIHRNKTSIQLAVGIDASGDGLPAEEKGAATGAPSILYVGRLLHWKGMALGLPAFARLLETEPEARLTIVGRGTDERSWRAHAETLGVAGRVDWVPWLPQDELTAIYDQHEIFLFPSLHDSGGMVVLEALSRGLPVVCLDLGGPGQIVDKSCGIVAETGVASASTVIANLAEALTRLSKDAALRQSLSKGARRRANAFAWPAVVGHLYSPAAHSDPRHRGS